MKPLQLVIYLTALFCMCACKSTIKEQKDELYSRHLQRQMKLTIITTTMPDNKADMNLLLFNDSKFLNETRAKKIIDSLYKKKQIQPLLLVGFSGFKKEYGIQAIDGEETKQYKKFNDFVINELYPFIKKKAGVRKFNAVSICGYKTSALSAFDVAWNNDEKIGIVGMFKIDFKISATYNDSLVIAAIDKQKKRPAIRIWMSASEGDSSSHHFKKIMDATKSIIECNLVINANEEDVMAENFTAFLLWAYPDKTN